MSAPPLIVHIIFRLDVGGMENGLVNLINGMPANRYRHAIVCLKDYTDFSSRLQRDDVALYALNKKDGKDLFLYYRVWRLMRTLRPDIVHTRNLGTIDMLFPAALAGVRARVHGEHGWDMVDLHGKNRKYRLLRRLSRFVASRYITVSTHLRDWLIGTIGVTAAKVSYICNGVDTRKFAAPVRQSSADSGMPFGGDGSFVIGTVGRVVQVKDQLCLARAFVKLLECLPDARDRLRLVIVGDGPLLAELRDFLDGHGVLNLCWLPGRREDVAAILPEFDVFVLPSLNEGISNTILESMASGLPVIATDVGGNPELVADGETGILVPPSDPGELANALRRYVEDPSLAATHGVRARERAEREFSVDRMIAGYLEVYDELTSERRIGVAQS